MPSLQKKKTSRNRVLLILADGASPTLLRRLFARGELPAIQRYLTSVSGEQKILTSYPSVTGPTFAPFLTGCFPGTCNLPGVRWFDRHLPSSARHAPKRFRNYFGKGVYLMDHDLSRSVRTLFELVPDSYNVLSVLKRGTGLRRDPGFFWAPYLYLQSRQKGGMQRLEESIFRLFMKTIEKDPSFVFFYFPTIDALTHQHGLEHPEVKAAYRRLDAYFEAMVGLLRSRGIWEETLVILTSDHGMSDVSQYFDLDRFVEGTGLKTCYLPKGLRGWKEAEAISLPSGNAMSNIYVRQGGSRSWQRHSYFEEIAHERRELLEGLVQQPGVLLVAGRSAGGGVMVQTKKGAARMIARPSVGFSYETAGGDPFGYAGFPAVSDEKTCYETTRETDFPDAPLQLLQFFRSPRAGDLLVAAEKGYEVRAREFECPVHVGTHGSFFSEHMWVPFYANRPQPSVRRSTEVFRVMAEHLGVTPPHPLDA